MSFWGGYKLQDFLFKDFNTKTVPGFVGVCVALLSVGILYEGLYYLKKHLLEEFFTHRRRSRHQRTPGFEAISSEAEDRNEAGGESSSSLLRGEATVEEGGARRLRTASASNIFKPEILYLLTSSFLHSIYAFLGYTLMNAVMTFNTWVLVAVCVGIGLGFFCFRTGSSYDDSYSQLSTSNQTIDHTETNKTATEEGGGGGGGDGIGPSTRSPRTRARQGGAERQQRSSKEGDEDRRSATAQVIVVGAQVHNQQSL